MLGLRLGSRPQVVITTTPKPVRLIRELIANPETITTRGTTYDNRANLPPGFFAQIIRRYEGTRIGRRELNAELLEQIEVGNEPAHTMGLPAGGLHQLRETGSLLAADPFEDRRALRFGGAGGSANRFGGRFAARFGLSSRYGTRGVFRGFPRALLPAGAFLRSRFHERCGRALFGNGGGSRVFAGFRLCHLSCPFRGTSPQ
jgi:hypothetical protein